MTEQQLSFTTPDGTLYISAPNLAGYKCPSCALFHRRKDRACPHFGAGRGFPGEPDCLRVYREIDIVWVKAPPDPNPL